MYSTLPYKTKQFFFVLIKLSIVVGAFYFIYNKLISNNELHFNDFVAFLTRNDRFSLKNMLFLLILSSFNWFFEILKWRYLVNSTSNISFFEALKQSLGALTASLFTPNRIGDYGAKALYFTSGFRKRIVLLNLIGNIMQMTITTVIGCIGLYFFLTKYQIDYDVQRISRLLITIVVIFTLFVVGIKQKKYKIKGFALSKVIHFIKTLSIRIKTLGLALSFLRYSIFAYQFYFLIQLFGFEITYLNAMICISSMYLLASIIPSIFIFDVVIKGSVAVYLFSKVGLDEFSILSIVLCMWILNFVIPSCVGSFFVLTFKLPRKTTS